MLSFKAVALLRGRGNHVRQNQAHSRRSAAAPGTGLYAPSGRCRSPAQGSRAGGEPTLTGLICFRCRRYQHWPTASTSDNRIPRVDRRRPTSVSQSGASKDRLQSPASTPAFLSQSRAPGSVSLSRLRRNLAVQTSFCFEETMIPAPNLLGQRVWVNHRFPTLVFSENEAEQIVRRVDEISARDDCGKGLGWRV